MTYRNFTFNSVAFDNAIELNRFLDGNPMNTKSDNFRTLLNRTYVNLVANSLLPISIFATGIVKHCDPWIVIAYANFKEIDNVISFFHIFRMIVQ